MKTTMSIPAEMSYREIVTSFFRKYNTTCLCYYLELLKDSGEPQVVNNMIHGDPRDEVRSEAL